MSIDQITKLPSMADSEINTMQRILDNVHREAVGIVYTEDTAKAASLADSGKVVLLDDGCIRRVYFKTGKGFVGYITLT
jgi:hypothetical protein